MCLNAKIVRSVLRSGVDHVFCRCGRLNASGPKCRSARSRGLTESNVQAHFYSPPAVILAQ